MLNRFFLFVFTATTLVAASFGSADETVMQSASPSLQTVSIADDGTLNIPLIRIRAITETRTYLVNVTKNHSEYRKNTSGGVEVVDVPYQVESESLGELKIPVFEQIEWSVSADKYRGFDTKGNALSADQLKARFKTPAPAVVCPVGSVVPIASLPLLSDAATILTIDDFEPGVIKDNNPQSPIPPATGTVAPLSVSGSNGGNLNILKKSSGALLTKSQVANLAGTVKHKDDLLLAILATIVNEKAEEPLRLDCIEAAVFIATKDSRFPKTVAESLSKAIEAASTPPKIKSSAINHAAKLMGDNQEFADPSLGKKLFSSIVGVILNSHQDEQTRLEAIESGGFISQKHDAYSNDLIDTLAKVLKTESDPLKLKLSALNAAGQIYGQ